MKTAEDRRVPTHTCAIHKHTHLSHPPTVVMQVRRRARNLDQSAASEPFPGACFRLYLFSSDLYFLSGTQERCWAMDGMGVGWHGMDRGSWVSRSTSRSRLFLSCFATTKPQELLLSALLSVFLSVAFVPPFARSMSMEKKRSGAPFFASPFFSAWIANKVLIANKVSFSFSFFQWVKRAAENDRVLEGQNILVLCFLLFLSASQRLAISRVSGLSQEESKRDRLLLSHSH